VKQGIHPGVFIAVIAVAVVIAAIACISILRAPPAAVAQTERGERATSGAEASAAMKAAHGGPTEAQREQIQEWKKSHPDAYTRY